MIELNKEGKYKVRVSFIKTVTVAASCEEEARDVAVMYACRKDAPLERIQTDICSVTYDVSK